MNLLKCLLIAGFYLRGIAQNSMVDSISCMCYFDYEVIRSKTM